LDRFRNNDFGGERGKVCRTSALFQKQLFERLNANAQEFHLKDYLDVLERRRDVAVIFFLTTVLVVAIGSFIMRPVYRATTTLLIDLESPNVLTTTGMVELQSQNYFSYKEYFQSQVEILTSYGLARKVFDEFGLRDMPAYAHVKEPVKKFLKTIKAEPIRDTRLVKLSVDNRNAELAARIANRMAQLYVMRNLYYISKNELMNLLKNEYLKLEAKQSEYAKVYKEGHPEMIKLRDEMAELTEKIDQEKSSQFNYENIESYLGKDSKHALAGLKANNISIQDPAEKPVVPIRPKKLFNIILAVIIGAFGGIGAAFFFEYLDDSVRTVEDIERVTGWPLLGNVPDIDPKGVLKESEKDTFVHFKPKDPIAEVYRIIRTRVLFSSTGEHPLKSILVTSPGPQEGKTTTLCNLGIALAQNQKKVLLVDADMRKPRLHEVFDQPNEEGLSNFLAGQSPFKDVVKKTGIENLFFTCGGILPPNPSELLASHATADFVAKAKQEFDFVLFDSPPIAMVSLLSRKTSVAISRLVIGYALPVIVVEVDEVVPIVSASCISLIFTFRATLIRSLSITVGFILSFMPYSLYSIVTEVEFPWLLLVVAKVGFSPPINNSASLPL